MSDFLTKSIERLRPGARWELLDDRLLWLSPEIDQPSDAEIQAECAAVISEEKAAAVRNRRGELLRETDWWAVADRTMTEAEINYRQALRDVPQQPGFPNSVEWPTKLE